MDKTIFKINLSLYCTEKYTVDGSWTVEVPSCRIESVYQTFCAGFVR
jgi:hypothetical protein